MKPNASTPPKTPSSTRTNGIAAPGLISSGFTKLSMLLTTSTPQTSMNTPQAISSCENSQIAAPPQTSGGPIGTGESRKDAAPRGSAGGTPAVHSAAGG